MDQRKEFLEKFAVQVKGIKEIKLNEEIERMKHGIEEVIDGYKSFIEALGGGFLEIAENYNECLRIAKMNMLIGDTRLRARIKDFSSSSTNTDKKILDDVFGMEIVTGTEDEKEILMLFNHLAFETSKDKKYNKINTGYAAYHCMGDLNPKDENLKEKIIHIVKEAKTREYKYSKSEPNYNDKKNLVPVFPILQEYISDPDNLNELVRVLEEMVEFMKLTETKKHNIPVIEFHFLTSEKAQEALYGAKANHANYKKANQKLIEDCFLSGKLIRGINAPWKFEGGTNTEGLKLQDFYETLSENWPFLKDEIVYKRTLGEEIKDKEKISKYDVLTASQFPFLRKYLNGNYQYNEEKNSEKWGLLKALMIAYKIDKNENYKNIEEGIITGMEQMWTK